jgi:hypothetical protein
MNEYNSQNTVIHYFLKQGKKFQSFSVWVSNTLEVVITPDKYNHLKGRQIDDLVQELTAKGWNHEVIN